MRISDWSSDVCSSDLPFFGIFGIDDMRLVGTIGRHIAPGIEQIAVAVALEHAAEIPAVAVIVGELGVLVAVVDVIDVAQKFDVGPQAARTGALRVAFERSEEHTSELQSLMRISYAVFCLKKKKTDTPGK